MKSFWQQVEALGRPVDAAAINAGVGVGGLFAETDLDEEINLVRLNCRGDGAHREARGAAHGEARAGADPVHGVDCGRDGGSARGSVCGVEGVRSVVCAEPAVRAEDTGVTVTALQPGPTDTDFFHRAGMDNTKVGTEGKKESSRTMWRSRASRR